MDANESRTDPEAGEILAGGVANAGNVVRHGEHVARPAGPHAPTIHRFLNALADADFAGAPVPVALEGATERLTFVTGDVAMPPYPDWVQTDAALASIARLLRSFHDASAAIPAATGEWSAEMADPSGGDVVCHNDVCLENVVFRDGEAVALIDFDYAAPGRPVFDLAAFARMCVPVDDPANAARLGWDAVDVPRRLRLVADEWGATPRDREILIECLDRTFARGSAWIRSKIDEGHEGFVELFAAMGGEERFTRRSEWWVGVRAEVVDALG